MEVFSVKDLTFSYPGQNIPAISHVDFSVSQGEFVVLCGPSGCGKTTLMRLMKPELAPFGALSGEIDYIGRPISGLSGRQSAEEIGFVLQNPESQLVADKVWRELSFGLENLGQNNASILRRVAEVAGFLGIGEWFHRDCADLSGGQKQLLSLASILAMNPKVLLLDEPVGQLDPVGAREFLNALFQLNRELGLTVVIAEHRLEDLFAEADRIVLMHEGRIVCALPPRKLGDALPALPQAKRTLPSMPSASRIWHGLDGTGACPLTVREGRAWLGRYACEHPPGEPAKAPEAKAASGHMAVSLRETWFRYDQKAPDILKGARLDIRQGEIFALLGENGSGKTTLLRIVSGHLRPYRGSVRLFGKKPERYQNGVALLPQDPQTVFLQSTVREDLLEVLLARGISRGDALRQIGARSEELELYGVMDRHPYDLSGGEQQRAALCKALLLEPEILLLDEPTKGIDAAAKEILRSILHKRKDRGVAVLLVTHDVEFAAVTADRCAMLFDGAVIGAAAPREFFSENAFYTTAASRISRICFPDTVTVEQVIRQWKREEAQK